MPRTAAQSTPQNTRRTTLNVSKGIDELVRAHAHRLSAALGGVPISFTFALASLVQAGARALDIPGAADVAGVPRTY